MPRKRNLLGFKPKLGVIASVFLFASGAISTLMVIGIIPPFFINMPNHIRSPNQWTLIFSDEFDGNDLNLSKWNYNYPTDWPHGGHTQNHEAYMAEENVLLEQGMLRIKGENRRHPLAPAPEESPWGWRSYNYTAGAINTRGKFSAKYGYFEARMKFPEGPSGFWPAFWTLNVAGEWPPEIDIHEWISNEPTTLHTTFHWYENGTGHKMSGQAFRMLPDLSKEFHIYGLEWSPQYLTWYYDNYMMWSYTNASAIAQLKAQYIIINLAVAGWASAPDNFTVWPAYYDVDWVRVWQINTT
nr:glycoside hydrolase family 16 protein [Candidatus Sigynarchaeota archaeon]